MNITTESCSLIEQNGTPFSTRFNHEQLEPDDDLLLVTDLFCGAGGTSTGILKAGFLLRRNMQLLAINHWPSAIATHSLNHPHVRHLCESLDSIDPRKQVKKLHLLAASPECTHHSSARGGKPCSDQSRATAWHVLRWAEAVPTENIMIENVPELLTWGPLDDHGRPIKKKKGQIFDAFINSLRSLNYNVDWRIINCADYGDPTLRQRLIILCRKDKAVIWPDSSHADPDNCPPDKLPWRAARGIIDWDLAGNSIFGRKRPLKPTTLLRVLYGVKKFSHLNPQPFLIQLRGTSPSHIRSSARSLDDPLPTITAGGFHTALIQPFLIHTTHQGSNRRCHSLDRPTPTITGANRGELALVEPRVTRMNNIAIEGAIEAVLDDDRCRLVDTGTKKTVAEMDILLRMLQPHELAAGMSFPADYVFTGKNKGEKVKQIGNAVPVETAAAMAGALLAEHALHLVEQRLAL